MAAPTLRDVSPLVDPIPSGALAEFRRVARHDPAYSGSPLTSLVGVIVAVIVGLVVLLVCGGILASALANAMATGSVMLALSGVAVALVGIAGVGLSALGVWLLGRQQWQRWYRLAGFARANGLLFAPASAEPRYPGMIFGIGRGRIASDRLIRPDGRHLEYGNYRYTTGSGKSRTTHDWGYLAMELDRELPHMVLDARSNNSVLGSNLPSTLARDQVLSLEGDFDRSFTLYCPREYERDALYVFTPDLMALLVDGAAKVDVEIVDRWLLLYSSVPFALHEPTVQERLLSIVDTVGAQILRQTARYRDERAAAVSFADHRIAPPGQRLRTGVPVGAALAVVAVVAGGVLPQLFRWGG